MAIFNVSRRAERGENPKQLRRRGMVPMAIVDRAHKTHMVAASGDAVKAAVNGADAHGLIDIAIEGETATFRTMVKSIERDIIAKTILSVSLQEVAPTDTIKAEVHVAPTGHSDDTDREDVVLTAVTTELKVKSMASDFPDEIAVDVSNLHVGDHLRAGDVTLPEGVELVSSPEAVLFNVSVIEEPDLPVVEKAVEEPVGVEEETPPAAV